MSIKDGSLNDFKDVYAQLNSAQKQAVDNFTGPMLVIAGPGTGKTQLLSARVAKILQDTDTLPQNILCLTFTDNGTANMRDRLSKFIGQSAYDVQISTYHAFGSNIINQYGEYFTDETPKQAIDELKKYQIVSAIADSLPYRDKLKYTQYRLKNLMDTISEIKRALLTPDNLQAIAEENQQFINSFNTELAEIFSGLNRMSGKYAKDLHYYTDCLEAAQKYLPAKPVHEKLGSLGQALSLSLSLALLNAKEVESTKPLTKWKDAWLIKNSDNKFILADGAKNERLISLANVVKLYQDALNSNGYYDFDDMILRAISAIRTNQDLMYSLQERYQYILLDEFQDTNSAQAELVYLLTDNPINEGKPNVMAVGDDDQAIFAFQGALFSNMLDFYKRFNDTKLVNLNENYRSHADILEVAQTIAGQISERLVNHFEGTTKKLVAAKKQMPQAQIVRQHFPSQPAELAWVAEQIVELIHNGTAAHEIAVLAPKHAPLESLTPYLSQQGIPMRYEKRENILETSTIQELLTMCRLIVSIGKDEKVANYLWPAVLSYPYMNIATQDIWQLSWQVSSTKHSGKSQTCWTKEILSHPNPEIKQLGIFMTHISQLVSSESAETILDYLIGSVPISLENKRELISPYRQHYLSSGDGALYDAISALTVLRSKLRDYQKSSQDTLHLEDLLALIDAYEAAEQKMINTNPYSQSESAVELMTAFKAKGLEYQNVFLLSVDDETWGGSGQNDSNKLTLPANLAPTRHSGTTEDERLRLFFVAVTRAKHSLYLTSYQASYSGKTRSRLKYLDERETESGTYKAYALPEKYQTVLCTDREPPAIETLENYWTSRHLPGDETLRELLSDRLYSFQLSPTHLNSFLDLVHGGPRSFFVNSILRFPQAPGYAGEFGNAVHETLDWQQKQFSKQGVLPDRQTTLGYFVSCLGAKHLPTAEFERRKNLGLESLTAYLDKHAPDMKSTDKSETNFRSEGVFTGKAHLTGKIDKLVIDETAKTIEVIDYKTGKSYNRWKADPKLHKYRQQLYCYKLLVEGSHSFKGYTVTGGRLDFVQPDSDGKVISLPIKFNAEELERTSKLLQAVWARIQVLDFPDTSNYPATLAGIQTFENDLLKGNI